VQSPIAGKILVTISNGSWHSVKNVAEKLNVSVEDVTEEATTLSESGVLIYDEKTNKVKLSPWLLELEEKAEAAATKFAVGSIILPPEGQVAIQNIVISNFLDKPVELGIRTDTKLREISISKVE
jgi:biotin operon repressor